MLNKTLLAAVAVVALALLLGQLASGHFHGREDEESCGVDDSFYAYPGVSSAEILRARGFRAREFTIETSDGHRLRITRGRNPLFEGGSLPDKEPILFVHGILSTSNNFLLNYKDARPADFGKINLRTISQLALNALLYRDPSAKSLPLLAMNFGHEVWLLDRRGAPGSRETFAPTTNDQVPLYMNSTISGDSEINDQEVEEEQQQQQQQVGEVRGDESVMGALTSFINGLLRDTWPARDPMTRFWDFGYDEQARVDFPETVEFVLAQSGKPRLALVTHSAGGAIALMAQSLYPERLEGKISATLHWAPAFARANNDPGSRRMFDMLSPALANFAGPFPAPALAETAQKVLSRMCSRPGARITICRILMDNFFGKGGGREPAEPEFMANQFYPTAAREITQLGQMVGDSPCSMRAYDFGPRRNMRLYGNRSPPAYDLSKLRVAPNSVAFYVAASDSMATPASVAYTRKLMPVPTRQRTAGNALFLPFSHSGFIFNKEAPRQAILPSMRDLERMAL